MTNGWLARRRAFLFDLDGTLVDSSPAHAHAFREVLLDVAPELVPTFDYERVRGISTPDALALLGVSDAGTRDRASDEKRRRYRIALDAGAVQAFPSAADLLAHLASRERTIAIVTAASRASADRVLALTGLAQWATHLVTSEDVAHGKPAPDPFLHALKLVRAAPDSTLVIEDAMPGIRAARAAGIDAVLVHGLPPADDACPRFATLAEFHQAVLAEIP